MAIARVQQNSGTAGAATISINFGVSPTNGNLMVATVYSSLASLVTSMTSAGWSTAVQQDDDSFHSASIFYKIAGAGESSTVTAQSTASGSMHMCIAEYSGVAAVPLDKTVSATSGAVAVNSQTTGTTATTAQADELLIACAGIAGSGTVPTYTNSFTNVTNQTRMFLGERIVSATGTYSTTIGFTGTAVLMNCCLATFKATASVVTPITFITYKPPWRS